MTNLDELERLAKAAHNDGWEHAYALADRWQDILALIAEVRALRERLEINPLCESVDGIDARDVTIEVLQLEVELLREDLQAAKLLAHANAEMFKAEKSDGERYRWAKENRWPMACPTGYYLADGVIYPSEDDAIDAARGAK
jgi:hypothetical protein